MDLKEEKKLWKRGYKFIVGLDEAGRGPLAGPVTAAAVTILRAPGSKFRIPSKLKEVNDSKQLSSFKRERLYGIITNYPQIEWGIGRVGPKVIDRINILNATKLAMERAVRNLEKKLRQKHSHRNHIAKIRRKKKRFLGADSLILDGNFKINIPISQRTIIKADGKVFSCAAASILAKVTRDRMMQRYDKKYPQYGFTKHKGYLTRYHRKTLKKFGPCKIHRKSFRPVKAMSSKSSKNP